MNRSRWEVLQGVDRKRREERTHVTITWLDRPVLLHPAKRVKVVGVASDASPETKAMYGVKL